MLDVAIDVVLVLAGIVLIAWILWDVYQTVVVPRPTPTRVRLARWVTRTMWAIWRRRAVRSRTPDSRQRMLGGFAPLVVVNLLFAWIVVLIFGYGLILYGLRSEMVNEPDFGTALYQAGISVLTIGYGDVVATGVLSRVAEIAAGGTGVGVLALGVTYLFSLYGAFQRREELVTTLDARAGAPPSGVVMLETYARLGLWDDLRRSFADWEEWSARVLDTHVAYPILVYFRSSHDGESWVGAVGAVLDAAVLMATAVESGPNGQPVPRGQAVMTIKGGAHLVEDVGQFFGFADDAVPLVERAEFDAACERIRRAGLTLRTDPDTSWKSFADLRATYASRLNKLAGFLLIPPAQWIGDRSPVRHVERVEQVFRFDHVTEIEEVAVVERLKLESLPIAYLDGVPDAPSIPMERPVVTSAED
jgi:hypothetical protein